MEDFDELLPTADDDGSLDLSHRAWTDVDDVIWTMVDEVVSLSLSHNRLPRLAYDYFTMAQKQISIAQVRYRRSPPLARVGYLVQRHRVLAVADRTPATFRSSQMQRQSPLRIAQRVVVLPPAGRTQLLRERACKPPSITGKH